MSQILLSLGESLVLTLAVELLTALLLQVRGRKNIVVIFLANLLTNPIVNYCAYWALYVFGGHGLYSALIIAFLELAAVLAEYLIYKHLLSFERFGKLKLALLLNAASFSAGLIISVVTGFFN